MLGRVESRKGGWEIYKSYRKTRIIYKIKDSSFVFCVQLIIKYKTTCLSIKKEHHIIQLVIKYKTTIVINKKKTSHHASKYPRRNTYQNLVFCCSIWGTADCETNCSELGEGLIIWFGPIWLLDPCLTICLAALFVSDCTGSIKVRIWTHKFHDQACPRVHTYIYRERGRELTTSKRFLWTSLGGCMSLKVGFSMDIYFFSMHSFFK